MKRALIIMCISCGVAFSDEAGHQKLAEEALSLMDVQKSIEQSFESVKKMQMAQLQSMNLSPTGADKAADVQNEVMAMIQKEFSWEKIKADYVKIYAETFSEEELQGIIEFYKSPVGRSFIAKMPELMQRSMAISQKQMITIMPKIQEMTRNAVQPPVPPPPVPAK